MDVKMVVVVDDFPRYLKNLEENFHRLALAAMDAGAETADRKVPVDTSLLERTPKREDSWGSNKTLTLTYGAENTSGDPYGRFVEFGTRFTRAQPFITPALHSALEAAQRNAHILAE